MKYFAKVTAIAMTFVIGTFAIHGFAYANDSKAKDHDSKIAGIWDVDVVVVSCANPAVILNTFSAMHKYEVGGTGQVVPSTSPTALSAHMMIWSHVKKNDYEMTMKMYRFDGAGNSIGWIVVHNEVSISKDGKDYVGSGMAEIYNSAGNLVGSSCPTFVGTRFTGE